MSKPIKGMIIDEYRRRFGDLDGALIIDIRGIDANQNNALRTALQGQSIRVTVLKNTLARKAFSTTSLEPLGSVLDGPTALAFGGDSVVEVARSLVEWAKKIEALQLKGAVLDGELFEGEAGVKRLSDFPTREEAQARVVSLILAPARNVVGCAVSPGSRLLAIVKEVEERLEKGEEIRKIA